MNLPTKITFVRLLLIPVIVLLFCLQGLWEYMFIFTGLIYIIASLTDMLDGHIARKYNMVTNLGKFLDPIADKVLVVAGLLMVVAGGYIPTPFVAMICTIIILAREFIIGLFRQIAALKNFVLAADNLGKWKTMFTMLSLSALLFVPAPNEIVSKICMIWGYATLIIATVLTVWSGVHYIVVNKAILNEEKKDA
ncbi:MAG: CDP-diacylglycerol--glycerol-3-phosphate 3-phosphatidyltransferase [Clostridia bacterium]